MQLTVRMTANQRHNLQIISGQASIRYTLFKLHLIFFFFFRETNPPFPFLLGYGIAKVSQASSSLPIHGLHACTYSSLLPFFFLRPSASTSLEALIRSVGDLHHYMAKILGLGSLHLQAGSNTYRSHATSVPNLMSSTFLTSLP